MFGKIFPKTGGSLLEEVEKIIGRIAQGDLTTPMDRQNNQGILRAIASMQESLARIVNDIAGDTTNLASSSEELEALSAGMRDIARIMAQHTVEVDASAKEMEENLHTISVVASRLSVNMGPVSTKASESSENLISVSTATEEMSATIKEIAQNSEHARVIAENAAQSVLRASDKVNSLSNAAAEISNVISAITEISDQTKLLALNATIEAARAGEAGKGFAVVASEVKDLATQTSKATDDIRHKINAIQSATESTIKEINTIHGIISDVNNVVSNIAAAVEEQSVTARDIAENIAKVSEAIKEMTSAVVTAGDAVTEVNNLISESAQLTSKVAGSVSEIAGESDRIKSDATKVYATGMEVASFGKDIDRIIKNFKVPQQSPAAGKDGIKKFITFSNEFSVGVAEIDGQHKGIMDYINRVHDAVKNDKPATEIKKILADLAKFTVNHFATEEQYFSRYNYPNTAKHQDIHRKLLNRLTGVIDQINAGEDVNYIEVLSFLKQWLQTHILIEDKQYGPFLNKHGVR